MKLIAEFERAHDADLASIAYREKGILTHVSSRYSNNLRIITGAMTVGLWVILDDQYADAIALKNNRAHQPVTSLSEDEMIQLEALGQIHYEQTSSKMLSFIGTSIAIIALAGYILYVSYGLFKAL